MQLMLKYVKYKYQQKLNSYSVQFLRKQISLKSYKLDKMSQNNGFQSNGFGSGGDGRRVIGENTNTGGGIVGGCYSSYVGGGSYSNNTNNIGGNVGGSGMCSSSNTGGTRVLSQQNKREIEEVWGSKMVEELNKKRK